MPKKTCLAAVFVFACFFVMFPNSPAGVAMEMDASMAGHGEMPDMVLMGRNPAGVMGAGTHHAGKWMAMYRYMYMDMEGNRDGTDRLSTGEVLGDYMVAPEKMTVQMHMFGLMYGLNSKITLMAMAPYVVKEMDHVTRMGGEFTTKTDGIGDLKLILNYLLPARGNHLVHLTAGLSAPTGSIDERGDIPAGADQKLPYPMQLGSGTWDIIPGITCRGHAGDWLWGAQALGVVRLGENENSYTLGNRFEADAWLSRVFGAGLSGSARVDWNWWGDIDGADPELNPAMGPTADPDLRAGSRIDALLGVNYVRGKFSLAVEGGVPFYQDLDGPQLETDWLLSLALDYSF